jgi:Integrase core domain/leucine-zipper of insertion element IS481
MGVHANAKLGPAGRRELVRLIRKGSTERQAAACLSVAPATAHRWSVREREATPGQRASGAWAQDRSSRPHRSPSRTAAELERRVCQTRERTGWGPRLIAGETGVAHSTVHAILVRHGCSRAPRPARREVCRYEWPCPPVICCTWTSSAIRASRGLATRSPAIAPRPTPRRPGRWANEYFHAVVDDNSRLAYGELLDDERAATVTAFVERALAWFADHGITARRLMTDGAWSYTRNRALRDLLTDHEIRHIVTPPYTPRWNGKVERFHQTMEREWAKGLR